MKRAALWMLLLTLLPTAWARAAEPAALDVERLRPSFAKEGILDVEWAGVGPHLTQDGALWLGYAYNPLVLYRERDGARERAASLIKHRVGAHAVASLALFDLVQLGVDVPITLYQGRGAGLAQAGAAVERLQAVGVGDVRLVAKLALLRAVRGGFDVALMPAVTVPSGAPKHSYLGDVSATFAPEVLAGRSFGPLRVATSLGYLWRGETRFLNLKVGPELLYRAGVSYTMHAEGARPLELSASLTGATLARAPFRNFSQTPLELLAGASYPVGDSVHVFGGLGLGLIAGYGTPDARLFAGLRYAPRPADADGDRRPDESDVCPQEAEDYDGYDDDGGCPEADGAHVQVTATKLEINEAIYFDTGKATIQRRSFKILDEIARNLQRNPQITKLRIEGHTDSQGDDASNMQLSQARAEAVRRYLIARGIDASRLVAVGYGETRPIASNDTARGRERNRRVELTILEVDGKPIATSAE